MNQDNTQLDNQALIMEQDNKIIEDVYKMIKDASLKVGKASNKVYSAMEYCKEEDFSVRGITYEDAIENCSNCFQFSSKNIREYADLLMETLRMNLLPEIDSEIERRQQDHPNDTKVLYHTTSDDINITIPKGGV